MKAPTLPPNATTEDARRYAAEVWAQMPAADGTTDSNVYALPLPKRLVSTRASDITPEAVQWLWPGRLAIGKHTCIAGEPGTGKSQLSVAIIAAVTTGGEWPCGEGRSKPGSVIILSAEDGAADTIVPRLMAAGADLTRVHIISSVIETDGKGRRSFNLQKDIELLERKIAEIGDAALVIIDPVSSYLGKTDSHKNSEVRGVLEPFSDMADRQRVAILSITHFSKSGAGSTMKALHRFIGSIAFTGAPRAAFAVIDDAENEGRKLFLHAKNNLAAPPQGLAFRLEQTIVAENIVVSRVCWESEPVNTTADQAMAAEATGSGERSAGMEAEEFLRDLLSGGAVPAKQGEEGARALGIAPKTLKRARKKLGVLAEKLGLKDGWIWRLPPEEGHHPPKRVTQSNDPLRPIWPPSEPSDTLPETRKALNEVQGAHVPDVSTLQSDEHLARTSDQMTTSTAGCDACGKPGSAGDQLSVLAYGDVSGLTHSGCRTAWIASLDDADPTNITHTSN